MAHLERGSNEDHGGLQGQYGWVDPARESLPVSRGLPLLVNFVRDEVGEVLVKGPNETTIWETALLTFLRWVD